MTAWKWWPGAMASWLLLFGCSSNIVAPDGDPLAAYTAEEISYFNEIALGAEWGDDSAIVRRWTKPIRVQVSGTPTPEDLLVLQRVVQEINGLISPARMTLVEERGNLDVRFAPVKDFPHLEPRYIPGNFGFVWIDWNNRQQVERGRILIATDHVTQRQRAHLIREEITQALGLLRDSNRYPDSTFFQGWSETTDYTAIDRAIIRMLYHRDMQTGMSGTAALSLLQRLGQ